MMSTAEGGQLYKYTTAAIGYCGAPTCALFVLALFWERCNEQVSIQYTTGTVVPLHVQYKYTAAAIWCPYM